MIRIKWSRRELEDMPQEEFLRLEASIGHLLDSARHEDEFGVLFNQDGIVLIVEEA